MAAGVRRNEFARLVLAADDPAAPAPWGDQQLVGHVPAVTFSRSDTSMV